MRATWVWLHKDILTTAVDREIDAHAQDDIALSVAAKEKAAAEMAQNLLATERQVCALIERGLAQSLPVEYGDEHPSAILRVELRTVPPSPRSGSSPGLSWDPPR